MAMKQCCATGSLHTGTPTGRIVKVHGLDCYIADPPNGPRKGIVVIVPDAFGWVLPNNRILADEYAKKIGATVYLPEFMNGWSMPLEVMISLKAMSAKGLWNQIYKAGHVAYLMKMAIPWMIMTRPSVCRPRIFNFLAALRSDEAANLPVGVAGFCWGGKYVVEALWDQSKAPNGEKLVECGFIAHPSYVKYPDDIDKVVLPLAVAMPEMDNQTSPENAEAMRKTLEGKTAKSKDQGIEHEYVFYKGAHHGFAVRADEKEVEEAERGMEAQAQAVKWFTKWFDRAAAR